MADSQAGPILPGSDPFGNHCQISSVDQSPHLKTVQWRKQGAEPYTAWHFACVLRLLFSNNFLLLFPLWVCLKCQYKCCWPRGSCLGKSGGQSCVAPTLPSLHVRVASPMQGPLSPEDTVRTAALPAAALFWVSPGLPAPQKPSQALEVMTARTRRDPPLLPLDEATKTGTRHAGSFWDFYFFKIIHTNGYSHKHDFNQNIASLPHQQDGTTQARVCQPLPPPGQTPLVLSTLGTANTPRSRSRCRLHLEQRGSCQN